MAAEARDPRPTPGSLAQGTSAGKRCPDNTWLEKSAEIASE